LCNHENGILVIFNVLFIKLLINILKFKKSGAKKDAAAGVARLFSNF